VVPAHYPGFKHGSLLASTSFRHKAGLVLASVVLLVVVSALALTNGRGPDIGSEFMMTRSEEARPNADTLQAAAISDTTAESSRSIAGDKPACERDPWAQIDGKCSTGKTHKSRSARAANKAMAISKLPLGRGSPPANAPSVALADATGTDQNTNATILRKSELADAQGSTPTKAHKFSRRTSGGRDLPRDSGWREDAWSAQAYAASGNRKPSGRFSWSWGWSWCSPTSPCDKASTRTKRAPW
jgi:hypothetical protein